MEKLYEVVLSANKSNSLEENYEQGYQAFHNGKCWAEHNSPGIVSVLSKNVMSESGLGAILKFIRWQKEGLSESFLMEN